MAVRPEEFARRLAELRGPLSKEAAARRIGVGTRHYYRWEDGQVVPRFDSIEKVVDAYDLDLDEFIGQIAPGVNGRANGIVERLDRIEAKLDQLLENGQP